MLRRDVFHAIADPTRRSILNMIARESMNLNSIAGQFEVSRPAVSQHIKILTECGLVIIRKRGRERFCEPRLEKLNEVVDWIAPFREMWGKRFHKLDALIDNLNTKPKKEKR